MINQKYYVVYFDQIYREEKSFLVDGWCRDHDNLIFIPLIVDEKLGYALPCKDYTGPKNNLKFIKLRRRRG